MQKLQPFESRKMLRVFETSDIEELADAEEQWNIHHRQLVAGRFDGRISVANLDGVSVDVESWSAETEIVGTSPSGAISFVTSLNARDSYRSGGVQVSPNCIDVFGSDREVHAVLPRRTQLISCSLSNDLLQNGARITAYPDLADSVDCRRIVSATEETTAVLRQLWAQVQEFARADALSGCASDKLIEQILLATSAVLSPARQKGSVRSSMRYKLARRARDYMQERESDPPGIVEICAFLNTSERTLHYAFKDLFGISPMRFLKHQRLLATHRALKRAPSGSQVTEIALKFGFLELGRFAAEYRSAFGELPSQTLAGRPGRGEA